MEKKSKYMDRERRWIGMLQKEMKGQLDREDTDEENMQ